VRLAVSNIAWRDEEEPAVAELMRERGVSGVEIAPGKIAPGRAPLELSDDDVRRYRDGWNERGVEVVAMQALLFGQPDLAVFGDAGARAELVAYLRRIVAIGGLVGARALVFGSPKNRRVDGLAADEVKERSRAVFRELGAVAVDHGTCLCIEPNPPEYGCDWVTSAAQAQAVVLDVDHPGFGLHLDAAALTMAGEDGDAVRCARGLVRHFHASEPQLAPVASGGAVAHADFAQALAEIGYPRWVSIEMRQAAPQGSNLPAVAAALDFAAATYAPAIG
jgi:sugar phosphate isomerase/epimerase